MFLYIDISRFNILNLYFNSLIENKKISNSTFSKISYSNKMFHMNGLYLNTNINYSKIIKQNYKLYIYYNIQNNIKQIYDLLIIEKHILEYAKYNIPTLKNKIPKYNFFNQFQSLCLKININTNYNININKNTNVDINKNINVDINKNINVDINKNINIDISNQIESKYLKKFKIILKISGLYIDAKTYGLVYKFIYEY